MEKMDLVLATAIFGGVDEVDKSADNTTLPDPVGDFFERTQAERFQFTGDPHLIEKLFGEPSDALTKTTIHSIEDVSWDDPITTTAPLEKTVPTPKHLPTDGTSVEIIGRQRWSYTTVNGQIKHIRLDDPDLAPNTMHFDGNGNEIAA